jgi:hypothetical protein
MQYSAMIHDRHAIEVYDGVIGAEMSASHGGVRITRVADVDIEVDERGPYRRVFHTASARIDDVLTGMAVLAIRHRDRLSVRLNDVELTIEEGGADEFDRFAELPDDSPEFGERFRPIRPITVDRSPIGGSDKRRVMGLAQHLRSRYEEGLRGQRSPGR